MPHVAVDRGRAGRADRRPPPAPRRLRGHGARTGSRSPAGGRTPSTTAPATGSTPAPGGWPASIPTRSPCSTSSASATCCRRCSCAAAATCCSTGAVVPTPNSVRRDPRHAAARPGRQGCASSPTWPACSLRQRGDAGRRPRRDDDGAPSTSCGRWATPPATASSARTSRGRSSPASRRCRRRSCGRGCAASASARSSTSTAGWTRRGGTSPTTLDVTHRRRPSSASRSADGRRRVRHGGRVDERYDGAVVAVPAPVAATLVDPPHRPAWLDDVRYVPHVRLYAARRGTARRPQRHPRVPQRPRRHRRAGQRVARGVGPGARRLGVGARVRPGRGERPSCSTPTATRSSDGCGRRRREIDPRLFRLDDADVVQLIRWRHAVPDVGPRLLHPAAPRSRQRPPLVFAGDWLVQPCVEGAVRSGNAAAACFTERTTTDGRRVDDRHRTRARSRAYRSEGYLVLGSVIDDDERHGPDRRRAALPRRSPVRHVGRADRHRAGGAPVAGGAAVLLRRPPPRRRRGAPRPRRRPHPQPVHRQAAGRRRAARATSRCTRTTATAASNRRTTSPCGSPSPTRPPRTAACVVAPRSHLGGLVEHKVAASNPALREAGASTPCRSNWPPARRSPSAG